MEINQEDERHVEVEVHFSNEMHVLLQHSTKTIKWDVKRKGGEGKRRNEQRHSKNGERGRRNEQRHNKNPKESKNKKKKKEKTKRKEQKEKMREETKEKEKIEKEVGKGPSRLSLSIRFVS